MNKFTKFALAAVFSAVFSQVAHAAFTTNDLYLGFNLSSAQGDYIIDLGQATTSVGVGGSTVVDLSTKFHLATFNTIFASSTTGVGVAVVGGNNSAVTGYNIYATQIRVGGAGNPSVPGSSLSGQSHSSTQIGTAATTLTGNPWPTAGNDTNDATKSYTAKVGPAQNSSDFYGKCGVNPFGTFGSPAVVYLDLYYASPTVAYTYKGYFTFDLSTGTPHLTFTPGTAAGSNPPPPTTLTITRTNNTSTISFGTTNGATYGLIYTNIAGLMAPQSNWFTLGSPITGTGGNTNFTDTTTDTNRVYSVTAH
jgi:hypothetical protein